MREMIITSLIGTVVVLLILFILDVIDKND